MKTLLIAAGAVALMSGAAFAQTTPPEDQTAAPPASADMAAPADTMAAPAVNDPSAGSTMAAPAPTAGVTVQTVTNGPIPDTPENRAKYGKPMSNAGKKSAPVGN